MKTEGLEIEIKACVTVSRDHAGRCLRILEMYLDDNPGIEINVQRKKIFGEEEIYIKNYLNLGRRRNE